jgi:hypothetical protein
MCQQVLDSNKTMIQRTPKTTKSMTMTTRVSAQAMTAKKVATKLPIKPPIAQIAAMNARAHAIGCRMNAVVKVFAVSVPTRLKDVPSICDMIFAGL